MSNDFPVGDYTIYLGKDVWDVLIRDDYGYILRKDGEQPFGLALAEVIQTDKSDPYPFLQFRTEQGDVIAGNCFYCSSKKAQEPCECSEKKSKILVHITFAGMLKTICNSC